MRHGRHLLLQWSVVVVTMLSMVWSASAQAPPDEELPAEEVGIFTPELLSELPVEVLEQIEDDEFAVMDEDCSEEEPDKILECIQSHEIFSAAVERAKALPSGADDAPSGFAEPDEVALEPAEFAPSEDEDAGADPTEIPEDLLRIYPRELFSQLPGAIRQGLSVSDFEALAGVCVAEQDMEHLVGCILSSPQGQKASGNAITDLVGVFGIEIAQQFPESLILEFSKSDLEYLRAACPSEDVNAVLTCLQKQPSLKLMSLNEQFGYEIFELLPPEVLVEFPGLYTNFMTLDDFRILREMCPQNDLEALGACLDSEEVDVALTPLLVQRILSALLEDMDMELPLRLSESDFEVLSEVCTSEGEVWSNCTIENGVTSELCEESEDVLSDCLLSTDVVIIHFINIQKDKKDAFGRELYVEVAGLLAALSVDEIKELRAHCSQNDLMAMITCATDFDPVVETIEGFSQLSGMMAMEIQQELEAAGNTDVDVEAYESRLLDLFLTLPMPSIISLNRDCKAKHPETDNFTSPEVVDTLFNCITEKSKTDPISNPLFVPKAKLKKWMEIARGKVLTILKEKEAASQEKSTELIMIMLFILAVLGAIGIALMPLGLKKKFPDKMPLLWKASAVAAVTFAITILLLGASLLMMRTVQSSVATDSTSPKIRIADGLFDVIESDRELARFAKISEEGLDFIKTPLMKIVENDASPEEYAVMVAYLGTHWSEVIQEPEIKHLIHNIEVLKSNIAVVKSLLSFYKSISWIMGYVPIFLSFLAVVLYLIPLKQTLLDIAKSPALAAEKDEGSSEEGIFKGSMSTVWSEFKLIWPFMFAVVVTLSLVGLCISYAVVPFIESLIDHVLLTIFYIAFSEAMSITLYIAIGVTTVLLVMILAVYIVAVSSVLGTFRKILRARFHEGRPLSEFKEFWTKGPLAFLWVLLLPIIFSVGFRAFSESITDGLDHSAIKTSNLITVPLVTLVVFPVFFFAARGLKSLMFIKKYPVDLVAKEETPEETPSETPAA